MLQRVTAPACVWMRAGVIRFWLCDRDFDCESCPLDAALRIRRTFHLQSPTQPEREPPASTSLVLARRSGS